MKVAQDMRTAVQFLTRIPVGNVPYDPDALSRALLWFPLVGAFVGAAAGGVHWLAAKGLSPMLSALATLIFLVLLTGAFHEDGLADTADGLGGGWSRERSLEIMRDSRIGSYGTVALVLSLLARWLLLSSLQPAAFFRTVIVAHVLCRWTSLPLSYFLKPARGQDGQSARVAQRVSMFTLLAGSLLAIAISAAVQRWQMRLPLFVTVSVTCISGFYFRKRLGGITGDCFGAANQVVEIAVYLCGVVHP
jgi:adenosylcobinamide-GDP ribazoletransferase